MRFHSVDAIKYLTFDIFPGEVVHGIFSRNGGLSPEPWNSLNVGGSVGDETERVRNNRYKSFDILGRDRNSIVDVWQVHSADILVANSANLTRYGRSVIKADGIISANPDVTLFMRFADCTPILLYDPIKKAVGIVHAGWQGTVKRAVGEAVKMMGAAYGCTAKEILAAIGPAIGPDHYEVGEKVIEQVRYAFGESSYQVLCEKNNRLYFDLWTANELILLEAGVRNIEKVNICTACHISDWYSHRAEQGRTGRFGALIGMNI